MRVRSIMAILLMVATAACGVYRRESDSNPPFSSHYYRSFDVEVAWQAERTGRDVRLSGTVTNHRYAFLRDLELKARLIDAEGEILARETIDDFPTYIPSGKSAPFQMNLTLPEGSTPVDQNTGKGEPNQMRIGIIGSGNIGGTLARHLARVGHLVSIANSRGPVSLTGLANEIGAKAVSVTEAAKAGEIVIISIPTKAVVDLPKGLFANVSSDVIVVDTGNYHPELRDGHIEAIDLGMPDSRWVAQQIGRPVIKAFNNIFARSLLEKGLPKGTPGRIALSVFGDSSDGKATVLRLIDDLGFDPVDGGNLDNSWRQQAGTPAYCQDLEAAALRHALEEAVQERVADYRAAEEARIKRYLAAQKT